MGIIVTSEHTLTNGITLTNLYANIQDIQIRRVVTPALVEGEPDMKYSIMARKQVYVNKDVRQSNEGAVLESVMIGLLTTSLTNLEEQLYTKLKTEYTSCVDDL
jgi:hypothetical protein